jgi:hypothetical protein
VLSRVTAHGAKAPFRRNDKRTQRNDCGFRAEKELTVFSSSPITAATKRRLDTA